MGYLLSNFQPLFILQWSFHHIFRYQFTYGIFYQYVLTAVQLADDDDDFNHSLIKIWFYR